MAVNDFQALIGNSVSTVNVLTNDIKFNTGDTLTVTSTSQPPLYGTARIASGGIITYTLNSVIPTGVTEDTFTYTITESPIGQTSTGVVTILFQ